MIKKISDLHGTGKGKSVAILGPSPTIGYFKGKEDIAIAVNRAIFSQTFQNYSKEASKKAYFLAAYNQNKNEKWFQEAIKSNSLIKIVSTSLAPHLGDNPEIEDYFLFKENPENYNFLREWKNNPNSLITAPTIIGGAIQFADDLTRNLELEKELIEDPTKKPQGKRRINLYGCTFGKFSGDPYYFFDAGEEIREIDRSEMLTATHVIDKFAKERNILISIYGKSKILTVPKNKNVRKVFSKKNPPLEVAVLPGSEDSPL